MPLRGQNIPEFNRLNGSRTLARVVSEIKEEIVRNSELTGPNVYQGAEGTHIAPEPQRLLAAITATDGNTPAAYSWYLVTEDGDGTFTQSTTIYGEPDFYPAYEMSGNENVPVDGSVIVELRPGEGGAYFLFDYCCSGGTNLTTTGNFTVTGDWIFSGDVSFTGDTITLGDATSIINITADTITYTSGTATEYASGSDTTFNGALIINQPLFQGDTTTTLTTNQNNWNPGDTGLILVDMTSSNKTVTGLVPKDGTKNEIRVIVNVSSQFSLFIESNSTSSTSTNRIYRPIDPPMRVPPGQGVVLQYSSVDELWYYISSPQPTMGYSYATTISSDTNEQETESAEIIKITPSGADRTLTGLDNVIRGGPFIIENPDSTNSLILADNDAGSGSGKKFSIPTGDETIEPGGMRIGVYDETNGVVKIIPGTSGASAVTTKASYTKSYTDFSTAATSNQVSLFTLPADAELDKVLVEVTAAFTGLTTPSISCGPPTGPGAGDPYQSLTTGQSASATGKARADARNDTGGVDPYFLPDDLGGLTLYLKLEAANNLDNASAGSVTATFWYTVP